MGLWARATSEVMYQRNLQVSRHICTIWLRGVQKRCSSRRWASSFVPIEPLDLAKDIAAAATRRQVGVSLRHMLDFGSHPTEKNLLQSAQYLHSELPVRLAHRVMEIQNLPYGLAMKKPILRVRDWYVDSFRELRNFPLPQTAVDEREFTLLISEIKKRHNDVVPIVAMGIAELKLDLKHGKVEGLPPSLDPSEIRLPEIHQFLDRFYISRIGIRMLIGQHVALHEPNPPSGYIGLVHVNCSPVQVAQDACEAAQQICNRSLGAAPEIEIYGDERFTFAYVPDHLFSMVFELAKNSMRATVEKFGQYADAYPPVKVIVAEGVEDVTLKVSDEGGGIPRSGVQKIWTYLYTTAERPMITADGEFQNDRESVLAGYGYGLPLSRDYARYFGGDLQVISMEGYGTDAYLHLNRLGNSQEPLP